MGRRRRVLLTALGGAHLASLAPAWRRFLADARDPAVAQARRLRAVLAEVAGSAYGRAHGLDRVASPAELARAAPVIDHEALRPWLDRVADGEPGVLARAPVRVLERTSGSGGGPKLIPFTGPLLDELGAATGPWLASMVALRPSLLGTSSYWSVSPAARAPERTRGGLRVGLEDDTEYFGPAARWALSQLLAVPARVARIPDVEAWRLETAARLVEDDRLGLISVWSPSFLTLLVEAIEAAPGPLLDRLSPARRGALERALRGGALDGRALWPGLRLISAWTDAQARRLLPAMRRRFPGVEVQPKGLIATEGVVSFPLTTRADPAARVLAVGSHFLEFLDLDRPGAAPRLAHELEVGGRYSPLLTTSGGLVRYHLKDELRCTGRALATPTVELVGRVDRVSDLCGEKLAAGEVERGLAAAEAAAGRPFAFALVAPVLAEPPGYRLYAEGVEGEAARAAGRALEAALLVNPHYRYARELGQLRAVDVRPVTRGWARYEAALRSRGVRAGDVKPASLDSRPFWGEVYGGGEGDGLEDA